MDGTLIQLITYGYITVVLCTRFKGSGTFTEMCNKCLKTIDADVVVPKREFEDDLEDLDGELDQ
jgi:hypothetical protein